MLLFQLKVDINNWQISKFWVGEIVYVGKWFQRWIVYHINNTCFFKLAHPLKPLLYFYLILLLTQILQRSSVQWIEREKYRTWAGPRAREKAIYVGVTSVGRFYEPLRAPSQGQHFPAFSQGAWDLNVCI